MLGIDLSHRDHERTLCALAGNDHFAVLAALQDRFKAIEAQAAFLAFFAMATEAGGFEERPNIFRKSDPLLGGRGRKFANIGLVCRL